MSYLPSGTTYPSNASIYAPGLSAGGQDYVLASYKAADLAVSGVSTPIVSSLVGHNFSGTAAYVLGPTSPATVIVIDQAGFAASKTITISGTATQTVNGTVAGTATITSAFGSKTARNLSTNTWIVS
jgi:hypothetical protein